MKNTHRTIRFAPLAKLRQPVRRIVSEDGDTFEFSSGPASSGGIEGTRSSPGGATPPRAVPPVWPPLGDTGVRDTDPPPFATAVILLAMVVGILSLVAVMLWGAK